MGSLGQQFSISRQPVSKNVRNTTVVMEATATTEGKTEQKTDADYMDRVMLQ